MKRRILVTGSSGYLGDRLVRELADSEWTDRIVGIDVSKPRRRYPKFRFVRQDVREPLAELLRDEKIDTVCHLVWILPPIHDKRLMEDINKRGTENVLSEAARSGVSQILYTGSTTAYGFHPDNDVPLTEESPLRGNDTFTYSKNKREIEEVMAAFAALHPDIVLTRLRGCFVVGPGFDNPLARHLKKKFVFIGSSTAPFQYVHEDDFVAIMSMCIQRRIGGIFNVTGEGTITFNEMIKQLGNIPVKLPYPLLSVLIEISWRLRLSFLTEFPSSALDLIRWPWIASSEKLIRETGYRFRYDTRGAFADFARSVREDMP